MTSGSNPPSVADSGQSGLLTLCVDAVDTQLITSQIVAAGWDQSYDQVRRGAFRGLVDVALIGQAQVATLSYDNQVLARGLSPPGCVTLALVGGLEGRGRWRGHEITPDGAMLADGSIEIDMLMAERFVLWLLVLPESWLDVPGGRSRVDQVRLAPALRRSIVAHVRDGLRTALRTPERFREPAAVQAYEERAALLMRRALGGEGLWEPPNPIALGLEDLLRQSLEDQPSVPELAAQLRVSQRTLRRVSRDAFGLSPVQLAKTLRLNAVRRALQRAAPGARVWEVAGRHGFWHMGQFGRDYRRLFGETPQQTLKAAPAARQVG